MGQDVKPKSDASAKPQSQQAVTVNLYVSAEDLFNIPEDPNTIPQGQLDAYCVLGDDNRILRGGKSQKGRVPKDGTLNDFVSQVYANDYVTWIPHNIMRDGYKVEIESIQDNSGFFEPNDWVYHKNGSVTGHLKKNIEGKEDTYTIYFNISRGSQSKKGYHLDPKLGGNGDG